MTPWLRPVAAAVYGKPVLLVMLVMTVCAWSAATEIYWAVLQAPHHGESAALGLMVMDLAYSCALAFFLLSLLQDLEELRLPQLRQLQAAALLLILTTAFLAPCAIVWSLGGPRRDVVMMVMGAMVGTGGARLWRCGSRTRNSTDLPRPWRAVRLALGPPYATASWKRRVIELALLCAALGGAPMLVVIFRTSLNPLGFTLLLHIAQAVSFVIAIGLCWLWPLTRVVELFVSQGGALTELALLPGQGGSGQQLRRLCLVALSIPVAALLVLLALALGLAALEHLPRAVSLKVAVEFVLIPLFTLPVVAGRLTKPAALHPWAGALLMYSQTWWWFWIVWILPPESWHLLPAFFLWTVLVVIAIGLTFLVGLTVQSLRKLLRRPHPFVEISP